MFLFVLIPVLFISTCGAVNWVDYRSTFGNIVTPVDNGTIECSMPGMVCDPNCQKVWICMSNDDGVLTPILVNTCMAPQTCNVLVPGGCSVSSVGECSPTGRLDFECKAEGVFPDPVNCKKYHYCIKDSLKPERFQRFESSCDDAARGYHAGTNCCSKILVNNQCSSSTYPVPECKAAGQSGALADNPRMFYICSQYPGVTGVLYPYLYRCENCKDFVSNFMCQ